MFGHCKDCRWWRDYQEAYSPKKANICDRLDGIGTLYDPVNHTDAEVYAEANDDSGLIAGFKTGPMFGCVMFDRLTHHCEILETGNESWSFKNRA